MLGDVLFRQPELSTMAQVGHGHGTVLAGGFDSPEVAVLDDVAAALNFQL